MYTRPVHTPALLPGHQLSRCDRVDGVVCLSVCLCVVLALLTFVDSSRVSDRETERRTGGEVDGTARRLCRPARPPGGQLLAADRARLSLSSLSSCYVT